MTTISSLQASLLSQARVAASFLVGHASGIRGIAVTGSVAYGDVRPDDDLDFLVITRAGRLYTTRLVSMIWVSLLGKKRRPGHEADSWCLNLWLDESDLLVPPAKQTSFARLQIERWQVLYDQGGVFERFLAANQCWLAAEPGAAEPAVQPPPPTPSSFLGNQFEKIARWLQQAYMRPKVTREIITDTQLFFHPLERGEVIINSRTKS